MLLTFKKIVAVVGRHLLRRYLVLAVLMTIVALLEAVGIGIILPFLAAMSGPEALLRNDKVISVLAFFGAPAEPSSLVLVAGSLMVAVFSIKGVLVLFSTWLQGKVLHEQRAAISRKLFAHYLDLPYDLHLRKNMAHILHVISGVTANFSAVFMAALMLLCSELLVCATIIAMLLLVNPEATGLAVLFMLLVGGGYMRWGKARLTRIGREQHQATLGLNKSVMEGLGSLKETRILGAEEFFLRRFDRLAQAYMHFSVRLHVLNQAPRLVAETLFVIAVVGTVIAMSLSGRDLKADLPTMALFGMAFVRMLPSFNRILSAFNNVRVSAVSLNVLFEEYDEARRMRTAGPVLGSAPRKFSGQRFGSELILKEVRYSYPGEGTPTLDGLNISIRKGEIVGLVGRSGAGKTTLVDVILGLLRPESGDVLADGVSILDEPNVWRDVVGYIPQSIYLLDDTIRRNIAFAVDDESVDERKVHAALAAAQLEEFIAALPSGLDTVVGDRGVRLSGGQRQRIGIARALYRDPELLVLDEATSALDGETEGAVNQAIRRLARSKTILIIAHRLSTVSNCDRLFLIEAGKVADSGTYAELLERNAWFRRINDIIE